MDKYSDSIPGDNWEPSAPQPEDRCALCGHRYRNHHSRSRKCPTFDGLIVSGWLETKFERRTGAAEMRMNRDLNPHKAARIAMLLWSREYAYSGKGSMSFWDSLKESRKLICREEAAKIVEAPDERGAGVEKGERG